jgi:hypothetical protein
MTSVRVLNTFSQILKTQGLAGGLAFLNDGVTPPLHRGL